MLELIFVGNFGKQIKKTLLVFMKTCKSRSQNVAIGRNVWQSCLAVLFLFFSVMFVIRTWWVSSSSESYKLLGWQADNTASGQGSPMERSPVGSRFSEPFFLDVPETATEKFRTCGLRRNSSSLDKAPKMHESVWLNSLQSCLLTLP